MDFPRSSHQQQASNGNASVPEILSLPSSSLVLSMERLNEESEHSSSSSDLHSVCSYNSLSSLSSCGSEHLGKTEQKSVCSEGSATSRPRLHLQVILGKVRKPSISQSYGRPYLLRRLPRFLRIPGIPTNKVLPTATNEY